MILLLFWWLRCGARAFWSWVSVCAFGDIGDICWYASSFASLFSTWDCAVLFLHYSLVTTGEASILAGFLFEITRSFIGRWIAVVGLASGFKWMWGYVGLRSGVIQFAPVWILETTQCMQCKSLLIMKFPLGFFIFFFSLFFFFFFFLKSIKATPSASRADMRAGTIL